MPVSLKTLTNEEFVAPGRTGCPGCAAMLIPRLALKVLGSETIMVSATGCVISNYTHAGAPSVPFIHSLLPGAGSLASGIDAGLKALGKRSGVNLMVLAGDGGTADIGFQALSGAVERGHKFVYICYDNEGYMNTGGQRSGTTPYGSSTSTTPANMSVGKQSSLKYRKDMFMIMAAHRIPYAATASVAYSQDLLRKIEKAAQIDGPSYIHVVTPCNYRWGFPEDQSLNLAKVAVETHIAPLVEVEDGRKYTLQMRKRPKRPVEDYLKTQKRYRHLSEENIAEIQQSVDENWEYLEHLADIG
jgi:pyruvate ferredoxin oxidoreductase beta subunit